ncbi:hypothetical protein GCM10027053_17540 [Intrasporangium mesophilum]
MTGALTASSSRALASLWWVVVGAAAGIGVVAILTIGAPLLVLAAAMAVGGALMRWTRTRAAFLVIAGASFAPFLIAWLNHDGPGTVCTALPRNGVECIDEWSPWPFLAAAFVLVFLGILAALRPSATTPGALDGSLRASATSQT